MPSALQRLKAEVEHAISRRGQDPGKLTPVGRMYPDRQARLVPETWMRLSPEDQAVFEEELRAEASPGHPLHGKTVVAVFRCIGCDEVVFRVQDDPASFAMVRLTWRRGPETPPWPETQNLVPPLTDSLVGHVH